MEKALAGHSWMQNSPPKLTWNPAGQPALTLTQSRREARTQ
ncbi:hypothetical protein [Microvirga sp. M2]